MHGINKISEIFPSHSGQNNFSQEDLGLLNLLKPSGNFTYHQV
jgi:hypothetical protein